MNKKVIIIGAGIGGLATAVRLLSRGYEVKIYEKEEKVGGRVNLLEAQGFKFDLTASILLTPEIYKDIFTYAGKEYKDYIELIRIDPIYRVNYSDGSRIDFSSDLVEMTKTLEHISKKDSVGYLRFLNDTYEKYIIANENFLEKSYDRLKDFLNPISLIKAMELKTLSTTYKYVSQYIKDERIRQFLCFQAMYVGISPFQGPNIYTLIPAMSQIHGLWYIKGGMYSYIKALERLVTELGGTINTGLDVEEILINEGKAYGVQTKTTIEKGDIIVCNGDFPYAVNELIKDASLKEKYMDKKLRKMKYSCSTFTIYLGLKKKYPELLVHNLYLGSDFKNNIELPFKGKIPEKPSLYIYCPTRIDSGMAEKGKECLNVLTRVPNLMFNEIQWNENTKNALRKIVFNELKNIKGLEDIEDNIEYESYLTPIDLLSRFNAYEGTAFGLSPTLAQTNYLRPHIKFETVDKLYFVGNSVHPGSGVSIVLISSKLAAEEVMKG